MSFLFNRAVIIGVGQLGASVGMNLVGRRLAREVIGLGRSRANLNAALRRKAIHRIGSGQDLADADLIILAVPVAAIRETLKTLPKGPKGPLVIDVGSVKSGIVQEAARRRLRFVGCHPVAGTEKSGADAGNRNLFQGKLCVVIPSRSVSKNDVRRVKALWRKLGAKPVRMSAAAHDRLFAVTSHLPHALAFGLSRFAGRRLSRLPIKATPFVFSSFKDMTRVALSPVEMWRDIFLENRVEVLSALDGMIAEMRRLRSRKGLASFLAQAQRARREFA